MRVVISIGAASGVIYGIKVLEKLKSEKYLIITDMAKGIIKEETDYSLNYIESLANKYYDDHDFDSPLASGGFQYDVFAALPASMDLIAKFACGISDTLTTRAFQVALKEKRKIILFFRETPLSSIHLENLKRLSDLGIVIMPASPGFYFRPRTLDELIDTMAYKIMDEIGEKQEHKIWGKN
ncbi:MAG: UbiX family flavin prenyltransferase [Thermoplasmata archaeon]